MPSMWDRFTVEAVPKLYASGTYRTVPPERTLERVRPHLTTLNVTRVANVTGLDRLGVPVVMVCRPNSRSVAVSQGKGLTLDAARASGLMETIELHHAERITLPLRFATAGEMAQRRKAVDLERLPRIRDRSPRPHQPLLWIEGYELMQREPVWVPYEIVNLNNAVPPTPGGECFSTTSNGLASGNHLLEAILHGLCEVVERDATTLWYLSSPQRRAQSRLDHSSVDHPDCQKLLSRFEEADIDTFIWNMTSDVGLPAFMCMITDRGKDPSQTPYTSTGYGCHLSRHIALLRALTEAAQSRLTLIAGSRDDVFREEYEPTSFERIEQYRSLRPEDSFGLDFNELPSYESDSFKEDLTTALEQLRKVGIDQMIAVDLTDPELRIPVVRVIIPGLEGPTPGVEGPRAAQGYTPGPRARALQDDR